MTTTTTAASPATAASPTVTAEVATETDQSLSQLTQAVLTLSDQLREIQYLESRQVAQLVDRYPIFREYFITSGADIDDYLLDPEMIAYILRQVPKPSKRARHQ